jgi:hypothetical protein
MPFNVLIAKVRVIWRTLGRNWYATAVERVGSRLEMTDLEIVECGN